MTAANFKFKAWDKSEKRFVKSKDLQNARNLPVVPTKLGFRLKSRFEFFLSSGIKDSNGTEIYDGDVIQVCTKNKFLKDTIYNVYYEEGAFRINELGCSTILLSFAANAWKIKKYEYTVIGHKKLN